MTRAFSLSVSLPVLAAGIRHRYAHDNNFNLLRMQEVEKNGEERCHSQIYRSS